MLFTEKKTESGYEYQTKDVFGKLSVVSSERLDGATLDELTLLLNRQKARVVSGSITHNGGEILYELVKASTWDEETN